MKSKYLTAAISVAPFALSAAAALSPSLTINFVFGMLIGVILPIWSGKAQTAWREILGGDREGD